MLSKEKIKKIDKEVFIYLAKKKIKNFLFLRKRQLFKTEMNEGVVLLLIKNLSIGLSAFFLLFLIFGIEKINNSSFDSLIVCIAAAGPVMMGLYYSGLTFVASTTHQNLSPKVQNLLLSDSINSWYLNLLMTMSDFSLMWILSEILFQKTLKYSSVIVWILFVLAIAAFIVLSRKFFSYLEVESWFEMIKAKIFKEFQEIEKASLKKINDDFCSEKALNAREYVDYFEVIYDKMKINASNKEIRVLSRKIIEILIVYQYYKRKIPPESKWYFIQSDERNLYTLDDHDFVMASKTMVSPTKLVNDFFWFENKMENIFESVFEKIQENNDEEVAGKVLNELACYFDALIVNGYPQRAFMMVSKIWTIFEKRLNENTINMNVKIISDLFDLCIQIMLLTQKINDYKTLEKKIAMGNPNLKFGLSGIYESFLLKDILSLFEKLSYEKEIEGHVVTPKKFAAEELSLKIYTLYLDYFEMITTKMISFFYKKRNFLNQNAKLKAFAIKKEFEYWTRWNLVVNGFSVKKLFIEKMNDVPLSIFVDEKKLKEQKIKKMEIAEKAEYTEKVILYESLIGCLNKFENLQDEKVDVAGFSLNLCRLGLIEMVDSDVFKKYKELIYVFVNASVSEFFHLIKSGEEKKCYNPLVDLITSLGWLFVVFDLLGKSELSLYLKEVCMEMFKNMEKQKMTAGIIVGIKNDIRVYRFETKQDWENKVISILKSNGISKKSKFASYLKEKLEDGFWRNELDGYDIFIAVNLIEAYDVTPFSFNYRQYGLHEELKRLGVI
jgi:hypothetical protein